VTRGEMSKDGVQAGVRAIGFGSSYDGLGGRS
jgi:hypothetical protein